MDFKRVLPSAIIYVYDNNSTDKTAELAQKAGAIVRHEYQQGKGNVVRRMFQEIDAFCYILVDGDDTYPAESAVEMVRLVREHNADMVFIREVGNIFRDSLKFRKIVFSPAYNTTENTIRDLKKRMKEIERQRSYMHLVMRLIMTTTWCGK